MPRDQINASAREGLRVCVHDAVRLKFDLHTLLIEFGLAPASESRDQGQALNLFEHHFEHTDWTSRESVLPLIPIFEQVYQHCPRNFSSQHRYIDGNLDTDRLMMKEGKLIRLQEGQRR